jgi:molybdenum cofactor guanylyltransferase
VEVGVILLAGGKSSRMGTNKALLSIGKTPAIERIVQQLGSMFAEILLVTNTPEEYKWLGLKMVLDEFPGCGPLAGIHMGLKSASFARNLVVACDMPFVSSELGAFLMEQCVGFDAAVPVQKENMQPLFAGYQKSCLPYLEDSLQKGQYKLKAFLKAVRVNYISEMELQKFVDPTHAFFNMNNPEDYKTAQTIIDKIQQNES